MKIRALDRAYLVLYALITALLFLCGAAWSAYTLLGFSQPFIPVPLPTQYQIVMLGVCLLLLVLGLHLLFLRRAREPKTLQIKSSEAGAIVMSVEALDALVTRTARKCQQLTDVKTRVLPGQDGVVIRLKVLLRPDVVIPEVTAALQADVKDSIETLAGVHVSGVQIFVDNPPPSAAPRVE